MILNEDYKLHTGNNLEDLELKGLYLIRNLDTGMLKIGITNNLKNRYKQLIGSFKHIGIDPKLRIECYIETDNNKQLEKYLHSEFNEVNSQNEWFDIKDINVIINKIKSFNEEYIDDKNNSKVFDYDTEDNIFGNTVGFYDLGYYVKVDKSKNIDVLYKIIGIGNNINDIVDEFNEEFKEIFNVKLLDIYDIYRNGFYSRTPIGNTKIIKDYWNFIKSKKVNFLINIFHDNILDKDIKELYTIDEFFNHKQ